MKYLLIFVLAFAFSPATLAEVDSESKEWPDFCYKALHMGDSKSVTKYGVTSIRKRRLTVKALKKKIDTYYDQCEENGGEALRCRIRVDQSRRRIRASVRLKCVD